MKKLLLSAGLLMVGASAFAATDGKTYETKNGLTCENIWVIDRFHDQANYESLAICNKAARTATTDGKTVYVGLSGDVATIEKFDLATGAYLGSLALTLNGEAFAGTLAANQVGFDDCGHFFVASFNANSNGDTNYLVYIADLETGALTSVGDLAFLGGIGRVDYCDVIGDLTGETMPGAVIAASSTTNLNIFLWTREQGATEWAGGWSGMPYQEVTGTYPADQTIFNYASVAKFINDGTGVPNMFYVDGFTTLPAVYDNTGALLDSFANVDIIKSTTDETTGETTTTGTIPCPAAGTNGVAEAVLGENNFLIYSEGQYDGAHTCQAIVTTVNGDYEFSSMNYLWTLPADGLGQVSDSGTRVHAITTAALPDDEAGKQAMYLLTYKNFNGLGVYRIAEEGYNPQGAVATTSIAKANISVNGDVITVSAPANIEVYNVAGQKVAQANNATQVVAPANGLYVVKATVNGQKIVKKVIVK